MRLLNSSSGRLCEFIEGSVPPYAILSHTWGPDGDEVQYKDIQDINVAQARKAWPKISGCCRRALKEGLNWVWIDTCCIDKSSSAELSEAINSMWQWYKDAKICYTYLADIKPISHFSKPRNDVEMEALLAPSRWFTRGWTLQELIAPASMVFLSSDWGFIGDKLSLQNVLSSITGIEVEYLLGGDLGRACIAQKMCWASKRQTTRTEDVAYCLLGIFGINIPLLYGEGKKAFRRFQEELIKASGDQTIFAWTKAPSPETKGQPVSVLADHPSAFAQSGHIRPYDALNPVTSTITNQGIRIQLHVLHDKSHRALLLCRRADDRRRAVGVYLRKRGAVDEVNNGQNWTVKSLDVADRLHPDRFCTGIPERGYEQYVYVR